MHNTIKKLEPVGLWKNFAELNAVPRASKKEEKVTKFIIAFGKKCNLETSQDETGNVIIKKPATPGMEKRKTVALQSHLDMVHQKNAGNEFDFANEGIQMILEDGWVRANGTTLGADNGIGVAAIMAILESNDIPHPALEALFTIDEETGMTGALGLEPGLLKADILLNLDTENDRELTIGCAGGLDINVSGHYDPIPCPPDMSAFRLAISGLTGGHSGMDIHLGRGNSNKLMNRLLATATEVFEICIHEIDGGGLRNAIPRESVAIIAVASKNIVEFRRYTNELVQVFKTEFKQTDPGLRFEMTAMETPETVFPAGFQKKLVRSVYACHNGIYRMSPEIPGLVQSSNNLARILVKNGQYSVQCLCRSSVDSEKSDLALAIRSAFESMEATVSFGGAYPGWSPNPGASIVKLMRSLYVKRFGEPPHVNACHAGLECGIIGKNYPTMEMISFGPNITGAHSPEEKVEVASVQKFWGFLQETLAMIPG